MDSTVSSKSSFSSPSHCEESNSDEELNTAILVDENVVSDREMFYDVDISPLSMLEREYPHYTKRTYFPEITDSTKFFDLPSAENCMKKSFNTMSKEPEMEGSKHTEHVPLRVTLKRMMNEILRKRTQPAKESTCCRKADEFLGASTSGDKLSDTLETRSECSLHQGQKSKNSNSSVEVSEDFSQTNSTSSQCSSMSFLKRFLPKGLITITENSSENATNTLMESSSDNSATHIGRIPICSSPQLKTTFDVYGTRSNSGRSKSSTSTSSNIFTDTEIVRGDIMYKTNTVQDNDYLCTNSRDSSGFPVSPDSEITENFSTPELYLRTNSVYSLVDIKYDTSSLQRETNSAWDTLDTEDTDDPESFRSTVEFDDTDFSVLDQSVDTECNSTDEGVVQTEFEEVCVKSAKNSPVNVRGRCRKSYSFLTPHNARSLRPRVQQTSCKKLTGKSPCPEKRSKNRRSLSLPEADIDAAKKTSNNQKFRRSKTPEGTNFNGTDQPAEWNTSSMYNKSHMSNHIITSPIKPVQFLRHYFNNIANNNTKNTKQPTVVHKFKRPNRPFVSVAPATPHSRSRSRILEIDRQ